MGSVVGFDYSSLPTFFTAYDIPKYEWWLYLKKLNVVYAVALTIWNKQAEARRTQPKTTP